MDRPNKNKFLYLLISLAVFFLLNSFFIETEAEMMLFGTLLSIVFIASLYAIEHKRNVIKYAIILALIALVGHWLVSVFNPNKEFYLLDYIVTIVFFSLVTTIVLQYILHDKKITVSTLYGAICGYLFIGLTWSYLYETLYVISPSAFNVVTSATAAHTTTLSQSFIYYSFVTLTTLGYGDITPLSNPAKTFSWIEAIVGQVYLTVWIVRLVGLHIMQKGYEDDIS